jgi:hypothetical protein
MIGIVATKTSTGASTKRRFSKGARFREALERSQKGSDGLWKRDYLIEISFGTIAAWVWSLLVLRYSQTIKASILCAQQTFGYFRIALLKINDAFHIARFVSMISSAIGIVNFPEFFLKSWVVLHPRDTEISCFFFPWACCGRCHQLSSGEVLSFDELLELDSKVLWIAIFH